MTGYRFFAIWAGEKPAEIFNVVPKLAEISAGGFLIPMPGTGGYVRAKRTEHGLVLVRTENGAPTPAPCYVLAGGHGYAVPNGEEVTVLIPGTGGRSDSLFLVQPGAEFRLRSLRSLHWYRWSGRGWRRLSEAEHEAEMALREIEQGGGEWI